MNLLSGATRPPERRRAALALLVCVLASGFPFACTPSASPGRGRLKVIVTAFPLYDFARTIGGDVIELTLLIPPGVEAHSYEPTPSDMIALAKADLFIYTNDAMEPWARKIVDTALSADCTVCDASSRIELSAEEHDGDDAGDADAHESAGSFDPHVWLDPHLAAAMADTIADALVGAASARPKGPVADDALAGMEARRGRLHAELMALDADFEAMIGRCANRTIVYGGHFAFGYFARRYGLDYVSPYAGFSSNAEPTPARMADLVALLGKIGAKVVYYEELVEPRIARAIAEATGAELVLLHGAHNVSRDEISSGITYIEIMRGNMERLKPGLAYR